MQQTVDSAHEPGARQTNLNLYHLQIQCTCPKDPLSLERDLYVVALDKMLFFFQPKKDCFWGGGFSNFSMKTCIGTH